MALPRKGSRQITVDGHVLRWLARRRERLFQVVVERSVSPGQQLVVDIPLGLFPADLQIVSPGLVRQCVVSGLAGGFDPDAPRGRHRLQIGPGDLDFGAVDRASLKPGPGRPRKRAPGEKRRPIYVTLEPSDRARLEALADERGVGLGTLVREWILERLASIDAGS